MASLGPASTFEKLKNHFTFWEFSNGHSLVPILLQNLNSAFAVVSVGLPVSISLIISINYFLKADNHISPALGVLTNVVAFISCFFLSGKSHLFKSFSGKKKLLGLDSY